MSVPKWVELQDDRLGAYVQAVKEAQELRPNFIMVAIPNERGPHYTAIKKALYCTPTPIVNQIITESKVLRKPQQKFRSFATKIAIQMMCKLGAQPWAVKMPLKNTMVVGFDTYHDTLKKGASVGALVASFNKDMTQYYSAVSKHAPKQEISNEIPALFRKALENYNKENNCLPERIIFYRDGVGEGQIHEVLANEVEPLKRLFPLCKEGYKPQFSFIVVSKRINTKFFTNYNNKPGNPMAGTVIDDVVTLPERYDFFLVSQSVNQGTVNPTSYNVIENTCTLPPDKMQILTHKLTHLYYNWPGTVRVPAPCQYAHKLAFLVGESLHEQPSEHIRSFPFYL